MDGQGGAGAVKAPALPCLSDDFPVLIRLIKNLAAICSYEDQILDAHTEFSRKVDAGFDGKGHTFLHGSSVRQAYVSGLMILKADGMAQPVIEIVPVTRFCNDIECCSMQA